MQLIHFMSVLMTFERVVFDNFKKRKIMILWVTNSKSKYTTHKIRYVQTLMRLFPRKFSKKLVSDWVRYVSNPTSSFPKKHMQKTSVKISKLQSRSLDYSRKKFGTGDPRLKAYFSCYENSNGQWATVMLWKRCIQKDFEFQKTVRKNCKKSLKWHIPGT